MNKMTAMEMLCLRGGDDPVIPELPVPEASDHKTPIWPALLEKAN